MTHEYAHHICERGLTDAASSEGLRGDLMKAQELQADWYAGLITAHIGAEERLPFAHDGTAAVIALVGMDMLRRTRSILERGIEEKLDSDTHPSLSVRVLNLGRLPHDQREAESVRAVQQNFRVLMEGIWKLILPELQRMRARGLRPITTSLNDGHWLPN